MRRGGRGLALGSVLGIALLAGAWPSPTWAQARPEGEMRWALYVTVPPVWLDPAEVVVEIEDDVVRDVEWRVGRSRAR